MSPPIEALVFDAYGTLFDVHSVVEACERRFPGRGRELSGLWRAKQLEYSWLLSLMGRYEDFWAVTDRALAFTLGALDLPSGAEVRDELMEGYLGLKLFPDVRAALGALGGRPLAVLSNGAPEMLRRVVAHNGLSHAFAHVLSVDPVGVYKPDPRVYRYAADRLGVAPEAIGFVSSNGWDIAGATAFGFRTFWINRAGQPPETLDLPPAREVRSLTELVQV